MKICIILSLILSGLYFNPTFIARADDPLLLIQNNLPESKNKQILTSFIAEVSAYTLSKSETDDTPTIGAFNDDLSITPELFIANNYYKPGTIVCADEFGCKIVKDRMNARYGKEHFDIILPNKTEAKKFGRQQIKITILKSK